MDPSIVAALTGALTVLGVEVAKGTASAAGKEIWEQTKKMLGNKPSDALEKAQTEVAKHLEANPDVAQKLLDLLKTSQSDNVGQLVGQINADKVVVAKEIKSLRM